MTIILTTRYLPLNEALTRFQQRGELRAIIVNPKQVVETRAALDKMKLSLPVEPLGGCLVGEIWAEIE